MIFLRKTNIVNYCIMENREQQILSEIRQMISSMRSQLELLEDRVSQLAADCEYEAVDETPIDLDIEDLVGPEVVEQEEVTEDLPAVEIFVEEPAEDLVEEPVIVAFEEPVTEEVLEEPVTEDVVEAVEYLEGVAEVVAEEDEDLPETEMLIDAAAAAAKPAVIDAMATKEAWRIDIPGSPVKDIRSAISLNDRILFINGLFDEDPMLFQTVLTKINSMASLDEAVEYVRSERPSWDMESDEVYRFMMAVRRRIQ